MKTIDYKSFYKNVVTMYGKTTCFIMDSDSNRMNYSSGEVCSNLLDSFEGKEITEETLDENSAVASVMLCNFAAEMQPENNVLDDNYMQIIRDCFSVNSRLYSAEIGDATVYILYYE